VSIANTYVMRNLQFALSAGRGRMSFVPAVANDSTATRTNGGPEAERTTDGPM
jgi:hypothetical protein